MTFWPTPMVAEDAVLVTDTLEPPVTLVETGAVLLAELPSGSGELTVSAVEIVPPTLATAGKFSTGALAPEASEVFRVQVIVVPATHCG